MNSAPNSLKTYESRKNVEAVVFPTFLDLSTCLKAKIVTGGQFGRPEDSGAFTGDTSIKMLKDLGCTYVLCGHSDRRQFHHESNEEVAAQARAALAHGLHPIICIGEREVERDTGRGKEVVEDQLKPILSLMCEGGVTLAYEPVWAISRGDPNRPAATPEDAENMHAFIRSLLPASCRETIRILYGGSVKPENALTILSQSEVDGALVGGASLDPASFAAILDAAEKV